MRGLVWKLARPLGIRWVLARIDDAANGRLGPAWREFYWGLAGVKTWTSAVFGIAALALVALGGGQEGLVLGSVAAVGVTAGLLDKAWRAPHVPARLASSTVYRLLAQWSPELTAGLVAALAWTQSPACHELALFGLRLSCAMQATALLVLACAAGYLGLLDASFAARAPLPPTARDVFRNLPPTGGAAAVVAMALLLGGCGSAAQLRLGGEPVRHPDELVVRSYVCRGQSADALRYLALPEFSWLGQGGRERYLADAEDRRLRGECPCPAPGCSR